MIESVASNVSIGGHQRYRSPLIPYWKEAYLHDICNCYNTQGNTDGSIAHAAPSTVLTTLVSLYTYKFWVPWPMLVRGFFVYNNGGAAPAIVGGTFATNGTIVGSLYNVSAEDATGKPTTQVEAQTASVALSAETARSWVAAFATGISVDTGWYAMALRFNPGLSAGELARGNFVYYVINQARCTNTFQMKIADQGAFNSTFPTDISAATFVAWNGGGTAGSQLAGLGDIGILCDRM